MEYPIDSDGSDATISIRCPVFACALINAFHRKDGCSILVVGLYDLSTR